MADWRDGAAERDAAMLAFRQERAWEQDRASRDPRAWAAWARRKLADASPVAAAVIDHGLGDGLRPWQLEEKARAQVAESRAERAAWDGFTGRPSVPECLPAPPRPSWQAPR